MFHDMDTQATVLDYRIRTSAFGIVTVEIAWTIHRVSHRLGFGRLTICVQLNSFSLTCESLTTYHCAGPQNNMQPDIVNFETLASVYGEIGGTRPPVVSTDTNEASTSPPSGNLVFPQPYQPNQESFEEKEKEYEDEDEADRRLRDIDESGFPALNVALFPAAVRRRLTEIDDFVNSGHLPTEGSEWRVLHEGQQGRALEMDLGEGFKVQLHFLLASDEDYPI